MKIMSPLIQACVALSLMGGAAVAQDNDPFEAETLNAPETIGESERPRVVPSVRGQMSIARPAALVFAGMDTDQDYQVSRAEFTDGAKVAFSRADTDDSGVVGMIELEKWRTTVLGSRDLMPGNLNFDTNIDNRVTKTEFVDALEVEFGRLDMDGNHILDFSELLRIVDQPVRRRNSDETRERRSLLSDNSQRRQPRR